MPACLSRSLCPAQLFQEDASQKPCSPPVHMAGTGDTHPAQGNRSTWSFPPYSSTSGGRRIPAAADWTLLHPVSFPPAPHICSSGQAVAFGWERLQHQGFWRVKKAQLKAERGSDVPQAAAETVPLLLRGTDRGDCPSLTLPTHSVALAGHGDLCPFCTETAKHLHHTANSWLGFTLKGKINSGV